MSKDEFIGRVFDIAFGADAIDRGFTYSQVLEMLNRFHAEYWSEEYDCD